MMINGSPQRMFKPSRGIRQGDPLSPYMFLICAEGLSGILFREENLRTFEGIKINKFCPSISHLFFADDSLVFCRAPEKDCQSLKMSLKVYEEASGQTINLDKSVFMTSKNVKEELARKLGMILGIRKKGATGEYLGMSSQNGRSKAKMFNKIKDTMGKVLMG